jgi:hypothetical protein
MERVQASAKYTDSGWCGAGVEFCMGRADAGRYPITSKYVNAREHRNKVFRSAAANL